MARPNEWDGPPRLLPAAPVATDWRVEDPPVRPRPSELGGLDMAETACWAVAAQMDGFSGRLAQRIRPLLGVWAQKTRGRAVLGQAAPHLEALFTDALGAFDFAVDLADRIHPNPIRVGIVTCVPRTSSELCLDRSTHPGLQAAGAALERGSRSGSWLALDTGRPALDPLCGAASRLEAAVRSRWTPRQVEVIRLLRALGTQKEVARRLRVTTGTVCTILKAARWSAVASWEQAVRDMLSNQDHATMEGA